MEKQTPEVRCLRCCIYLVKPTGTPPVLDLKQKIKGASEGTTAKQKNEKEN